MPVHRVFNRHKAAFIDSMEVAFASLAIGGAIYAFSLVTGIVPIPTSLIYNSPLAAGMTQANDTLGQFVGVPHILNIPRLGIRAGIEAVGTDDAGRMASPEDVWDVAWYQLGAKPGEKGNLVFAGHYDSLTGEAIFFHLDKLRKGDLIQVIDNLGRRYRYQVTKVVSYTNRNFPQESIFGPDSRSRLVLVTCDGWFDPTAKEYDRRLVVYAEQIRDISRNKN